MLKDDCNRMHVFQPPPPLPTSSQPEDVLDGAARSLSVPTYQVDKKRTISC